ncbi:MAG: putative sugar O-methyltransferase [Gammaproteobacteria bacterium]
MLFRRTPLRSELVALMRREAAALGDTTVDATDLWTGLRGELREHLLGADPRDFLRWAPVRRTMVMRSHRRAVPELAHLRARPDWRDRWRSAIRETTLGLPHPLTRYPRSSANLVYHAYHVCRFEEATGRSLARMRTIVEFGGGYGRLCHLTRDLGFAGTYVIFDLPEVAVLQRFYLRHVGIDVSEARDGTLPERGTVTVVDPADLRACLRSRPPGESAFVAIGSLSETPLALRDTLLNDVAPLDAFLFFYSAQHDGIDNHAHFSRWRSTLPTHTWHNEHIPHLHKSAWYLFGHRR